MIKLSVAIITFNEERNIGRCLESIKNIADEIVIVDSGSTDRTKEICLRHGATFFYNKFEGHIEQKNFAAEKCSHDYILSIDADEALSPELKNSILELKGNWIKDGYFFNRMTSYCGKWIRHCGWYPDRKLRLFIKGKGMWSGLNPHDRFITQNPESTSLLKGDLLHYSYYSIEEHLAQVNKFTTIAAKSAYENGSRSTILTILISPGIRFIRDYIFHLGILDGYYGLVICCISSHATFIKYVKMFELQKKNKQN
jgi:glycosyltransferase involved in cell wall biosynthesis